MVRANDARAAASVGTGAAGSRIRGKSIRLRKTAYRTAVRSCRVIRKLPRKKGSPETAGFWRLFGNFFGGEKVTPPAGGNSPRCSAKPSFNKIRQVKTLYNHTAAQSATPPRSISSPCPSAPSTASRFSLAPLGLPGRFTISVRFRIPA